MVVEILKRRTYSQLRYTTVASTSIDERVTQGPSGQTAMAMQYAMDGWGWGWHSTQQARPHTDRAGAVCECVCVCVFGCDVLFVLPRMRSCSPRRSSPGALIRSAAFFFSAGCPVAVAAYSRRGAMLKIPLAFALYPCVASLGMMSILLPRGWWIVPCARTGWVGLGTSLPTHTHRPEGCELEVDPRGQAPRVSRSCHLAEEFLTHSSHRLSRYPASPISRHLRCLSSDSQYLFP